MLTDFHICTLAGQSSEHYHFLMHPKVASVSSVPSVFSLTRRDGLGDRHQHCGETQDLAAANRRIAARAGLVAVGLLCESGPIRRGAIASDLHANFRYHWVNFLGGNQLPLTRGTRAHR